MIEDVLWKAAVLLGASAVGAVVGWWVGGRK